MKRIKSFLGHAGGVLTIAVMLISPFLLFGWFQSAIASMGLRIHPSYSGGALARTIARPGYTVRVFEPVGKTTRWQRIDPFVQLQWTPATGLPVPVSDEIDLDGDTRPDIRVSVDKSKLEADIMPLNPQYRAAQIKGIESFSALVARVNEGITVRVPVR